MSEGASGENCGCHKKHYYVTLCGALLYLFNLFKLLLKNK